jgi:hypothetical protein
MCDIYDAKCAVCGSLLPIHLGDWSTKRNEVECFCGSHIPSINVRIFITQNGWKIGIRALTENAVKNKEINMPNIEEDYDIEDK